MTKVKVFVVENSSATITNVDTIARSVGGHYCTNLVFFYNILKYDHSNTPNI